MMRLDNSTSAGGKLRCAPAASTDVMARSLSLTDNIDFGYLVQIRNATRIFSSIAELGFTDDEFVFFIYDFESIFQLFD